ncbi:MAG: hypothetical protein HY913_16825 [Desulfomonile tiedjei]|nr:hypothetical protein [Desulfomonile tiedjei]
MILKLLGMILLGILSGALSYYGKNYYVGVFNDILGRDEHETPAARVGRGFLYGFLFPVYFSLILAGLVALIMFLIAAGIIAAIVFVLVWVTEKLLPHEWFGNILIGLFDKLGLKGAPTPPQPVTEITPPVQASPGPLETASPSTGSEAPGETKQETEKKD